MVRSGTKSVRPMSKKSHKKLVVFTYQLFNTSFSVQDLHGFGSYLDPAAEAEGTDAPLSLLTTLFVVSSMMGLRASLLWPLSHLRCQQRCQQQRLGYVLQKDRSLNSNFNSNFNFKPQTSTPPQNEKNNSRPPSVNQ